MDSENEPFVVGLLSGMVLGSVGKGKSKDDGSGGGSDDMDIGPFFLMLMLLFLLLLYRILFTIAFHVPLTTATILLGILVYFQILAPHDNIVIYGHPVCTHSDFVIMISFICASIIPAILLTFFFERGIINNFLALVALAIMTIGSWGVIDYYYPNNITRAIYAASFPELKKNTVDHNTKLASEQHGGPED